jgi:hypothetical protein
VPAKTPGVTRGPTAARRTTLSSSSARHGLCDAARRLEQISRQLGLPSGVRPPLLNGLCMPLWFSAQQCAEIFGDTSLGLSEQPDRVIVVLAHRMDAESRTTYDVRSRDTCDDE